MKTIKTERVYFNRFNVAIAICEADVEHIDGYDHAEDMEIVEGHVEVGMPRSEIDAVVRSAKRENEDEAKKAEREAKRKAEEDAELEFRISHERAIVSAIQEGYPGVKAKFDGCWVKVTDNGAASVSVRCEVERGRRAERAFDRSTKSKVTVGDYGEKTSYPVLKDGSFSWGKIAENIVSRVRTQAAKRQRETQQEMATKASEKKAVMLRKRFGVTEYSSELSVRASKYDGEKVVVEMKMLMSPEQAAELLEVAAGLVAQREAEQDARIEVEQALAEHAATVN